MHTYFTVQFQTHEIESVALRKSPCKIKNENKQTVIKNLCLTAAKSVVITSVFVKIHSNINHKNLNVLLKYSYDYVD
jgi:hypothetical protein